MCFNCEVIRIVSPCATQRYTILMSSVKRVSAAICEYIEFYWKTTADGKSRANRFPLCFVEVNISNVGKSASGIRCLAIFR